MRFIGSKRNLLQNIDDVLTLNIKNEKEEKTFCDIFAGTSIVGQYFKEKNYKIISNDLLYFSFCLQYSSIKLNKKPTFKNFKGDTSIINHLNKIRNEKKGFIYNNYSPTKSCERKYLTNNNALKIDNIRMEIDNLYSNKYINYDEYIYLIALLVEAVPFVSNIAGTYGAYLKNWDKRTNKELILEEKNVFNNFKDNECYNENANTLIKKISGDILYLDPPYNSRQYLPNYHLLETVAKYDNPKIKGKTGIREYKSEKSDFCNKTFAKDALEDLIQNSKFQFIVLSYNNEGIINNKDIEKLMKKFSKQKYEKYKIPYRRYKKDKKENLIQLYEMIYFIDKKI